MRKILFTTTGIMMLLSIWANAGTKVSPRAYVTGQFNPGRHNSFVNLDKTGIPHTRANMYLRKETVRAFSKLLKAFHKDHPRIKITILSATRNFYSQRGIWAGKWNGKRKVEGVADIKKIKNPVTRAKHILDYSSMPGTSRHHWGTDFDINSLNNRYFHKGKGKIIYSWLAKNAKKFGFGQPYTAGRKRGYKEEKWHWSYLPLSKKYLRTWNRLYKTDSENFKKHLKFPGSKDAIFLAPIYVNEIGGACK